MGGLLSRLWESKDTTRFSMCPPDSFQCLPPDLHICFSPWGALATPCAPGLLSTLHPLTSSLGLSCKPQNQIPYPLHPQIHNPEMYGNCCSLEASRQILFLSFLEYSIYSFSGMQYPGSNNRLHLVAGRILELSYSLFPVYSPFPSLVLPRSEWTPKIRNST